MGNKKTGSKKNVLFLLLTFTIISALLFVRDVVGIGINKYLILLICSGLLALAPNISHFLGVVIFLIPLYTGLPGNYLTVVMMAILLLKFKQHYTKQWLIVILVAAVYEFLHFIYPPFSLYQYIIDMVYLVLFFALIFVIVDEELDKSVLAHSFALGVLVASGIILVNTIQDGSFKDVIDSGIRLGLNDVEREGSALLIIMNPNTIALYCVVAIGFLFCLRKRSVFSVLLVLLLLSCGLLTMSRNFILSTVILLLLMVLVSKGKTKILLVLLPIAILVIINIFYPLLLENILERFDVADLTAGRNSLSNAYLTEWFQRADAMLWGLGIQGHAIKYGRTASIHNATIEILLLWGIIGLFLFVFSIFYAFRNIKAKKAVSKLGVCVFITFLVSMQFSRLITTPTTLLLFGFSFIFMFGGRPVLRENHETMDVSACSDKGETENEV